MTLTEIEQKIVDRVKTAFPSGGVIVEASPSDVTQYEHLGAKGCVLVRYLEEELPSAARIQQQRTVKYVLAFGSKDLRPTGKNHQSCYSMMDEVRLVMHGFAISTWMPDRDYPGLTGEFAGSSFVLYDEEKGIWWYQITYAFTGIDKTYLTA